MLIGSKDKKIFDKYGSFDFDQFESWNKFGIKKFDNLFCLRIVKIC